MITKLRVILFYVFLSLLFLINMWGLFPGENHTVFLMYISPFLLFSTYFSSREQIKIPYELGLLIILFIITTVLSTIYAVHVQTAFEYLLYIISIFLIFIYVFNNATQIKKYLVPFIAVFSVLSLIFSALLMFGQPFFSSITPSHDEQLIYRIVSLTHYPQGVFIFLLLIISYIHLKRKKTFVSIISTLILSILLWLSYLRSAYVGMLAVVFIGYFKKNTPFRNIRDYIVPLLITIITILFLLIPLADQKEIPVISQLRAVVIQDKAVFKYKDFENGRMGFITTVLQAIRERPIIGYGGGNFYYASLLYSKNIDYVVSTSHSLLLDVAVEHGVVSFLIFSVIVFLFTVHALRQIHGENIDISIIGSLFIGMLVLFQFNYYHLMAFLFVFFFVCAGVLYKEKTVLRDLFVVKTVSFILALAGIVIFTASYANAHGNPSFALTIYPIYDKAYRYIIADHYRNNRFDQMQNSINEYHTLYGKVPFAMSFLGRFHEYLGENSRALRYYLLALNHAPRDTGYLVKVYDLISQTRSEEEAKKFVQDHVIKYPILYPNAYFEDREWFGGWCLEHDIDCAYRDG